MSEWKGLLWVPSKGQLKRKERKKIGGRGQGIRDNSQKPEPNSDHLPTNSQTHLPDCPRGPAIRSLSGESESTWGKQEGGGGLKHVPY